LNQRVIGEKHLKLTLKLINDSLQANAAVIDAIYFNQANFIAERIQAVYQLQTNEYNGTQKVQLNLRHVVT
jgi:single-stranded-DNA-specific exonuclease